MPDPFGRTPNASKIEALAKRRRGPSLNLDGPFPILTIRFISCRPHCNQHRGMKAIAANASTARSVATTGGPPRAVRPRRQGGCEARRGSGQALAAGLLKLKYLIDSGYFGRILSVRGNCTTGCSTDSTTGQRPSWNYRKRQRQHHHHAVPLALCARPTLRRSEAVSCLGATHILTRRRKRKHVRSHRRRCDCPNSSSRRRDCSL